MPHEDTDWVLVALVGSTARGGEGSELTLFIDGFAVSGIVVSEDVFFHRLGLSEADTNSIDSQGRREQQIAGLKEELDQDDLSLEKREGLLAQIDALEPQFIVMVDVTIFGAGTAPLVAPVWRGRLSHVSAWMLGTYEESDER